MSTGGARGRGDGLPEGVTILWRFSLRTGVISPAKSKFSLSGVEGLSLPEALDRSDICECNELVDVLLSESFSGWSLAGTGGVVSAEGDAELDVLR